MPPLSNGRHELFAQGIAEGNSADAAHSAAGYKANRKNAWRLKTNQDIVARIAEIQGKAQERTEETLESVVEELNEARQAALDAGQMSAAISAIMGKAKILGLEVDPRKNERNPLSEVLEAIDGKTRGLPNQTRH